MTAVDLGSFSKASEVVGYTQSGLTHLVDSLERDIGLTLVNRDHSGISLTEDGEALMPAIREFLRANANLENRIAAITERRTETIRIAAYASIAMHWMPEILYRFRRLCPEVNVDLRMVDHALEPFELLEAGRTDVIFAGRQEGQSPMRAIGPRCMKMLCTPCFPRAIRPAIGRAFQYRSSTARIFLCLTDGLILRSVQRFAQMGSSRIFDRRMSTMRRLSAWSERDSVSL